MSNVDQSAWTKVSMDLPGAEHIAPTDAVWLAESGINTGTMSPEQTVEVLRNNIAAFLDANLRAKPVNLLQVVWSAGHGDSFASHQSQVACSEK